MLVRLANNVNQLAKWANTNHAMPADFCSDDLIHDLGRAVDTVEQTAVSLGTAFGVGRREGDGELGFVVLTLSLGIRIANQAGRRGGRSS